MRSLDVIVTSYTTYQQNVAACMNERGFSYWPELLEVPAELLTAPKRGTRAYAERYGYGVTTESPEMTLMESWPIETSPDQIAYQDTLNFAQLQEYERALYGPGDTMGWPSGDDDDPGCLAMANGGYSALSADQWAATERAWSYLADLPRQPAFDELDAEWAACMSEGGFTETSPAEAETRFYMQHFVDESNNADALASDTAGSGAILWMSEGTRGAGERSVAVADFDCRIAVNYPERYDAISAKLQEDYLELNRSDSEVLQAVHGSP